MHFKLYLNLIKIKTFAFLKIENESFFLENYYNTQFALLIFLTHSLILYFNLVGKES